MDRPQDRDEFIRKRAERQKKIKKRRLKLFFLFLNITLLCVAVILSLTVFFPIENLSAVGSKVYNSEQIINVSGIDVGDNLFAINRAEVLKTLKAKLPYIETVEFKRKLPGTLTVKVKDADEYFSIYSKDKYYTVSKSGWVLSESDSAPSNIFNVIGADVNCSVGTELKFKNEKKEEIMLRIVEALNNNEISIDYIDITKEIDLTIGVEKRFTVQLGTTNHIEEKINHLAGMIEKIPSENEGKINLSMWTPSNTSATFVKKNNNN